LLHISLNCGDSIATNVATSYILDFGEKKRNIFHTLTKSLTEHILFPDVSGKRFEGGQKICRRCRQQLAVRPQICSGQSNLRQNEM
jgi:hypothetical protein